MSVQSIIAIKKQRDVSDEEYGVYYKKYLPCLHKNSRPWAKKFGEEEALQLAGIALWRAMQSYDASRKSNFLTYLINFLRWTFLDASKVVDKNPHNSNPPDAAVTPVQYDDRAEVLVKHLNEKGRKVVELVLAGKNQTEISQEIGVSRQRVNQIFGEICDIRFKLIKTGKF